MVAEKMTFWSKALIKSLVCTMNKKTCFESENFIKQKQQRNTQDPLIYG